MDTLRIEPHRDRAMELLYRRARISLVNNPFIAVDLHPVAHQVTEKSLPHYGTHQPNTGRIHRRVRRSAAHGQGFGADAELHGVAGLTHRTRNGHAETVIAKPHGERVLAALHN